VHNCTVGGGLGGKKESGQLRFGGRERPFRKPMYASHFCLLCFFITARLELLGASSWGGMAREQGEVGVMVATGNRETGVGTAGRGGDRSQGARNRDRSPFSSRTKRS
jgi:hypothetical protein